MVAPTVDGIDLFKIAGRSISGWIPSLKTGTASHIRQPFCSQLEERLLLWLEYHPQVACYARGDIGPQFATTYRLPTPKNAPFAIGYAFEDKPHDYLPDVVGTLTNGKLFIAEAGIEDDKRDDRNLAKAEAARRLARIQRGVFWIGTKRTLTRQRHYNLVFLHDRRQSFPAFAEIAVVLREIWPWGEVASVEMDYLMKLVTTTLEWSHAAGETDVRAETLQAAAEPLTLRRDAIRMIDGAGPNVEVHRSDPAEQGSVIGTEPEHAAQHANQQQNTTETVREQVQTRNSPKCTFSGVVSIDLKRFLDSSVLLVECPDCARTRTLSPRNGVLRFPSHDKRKTRTPVTSQRWAMCETIWEVVGGERK